MVSMVRAANGVHWWVRADRDFYYRRRRDALRNRNGISALRVVSRRPSR